MEKESKLGQKPKPQNYGENNETDRNEPQRREPEPQPKEEKRAPGQSEDGAEPQRKRAS